MKISFPIALALMTAICAPLNPSVAQSDSLRVVVANLNEDVGLLAQQVKTLRLEIEEMRRENARLRKQVDSARANGYTEAQIDDLTSAIETLRREYREADEAQKAQITKEVTRQVEALAKETEKAIGVVAEAVGAEPQVNSPVHFSEDYPETGITYTVRSGDTLSKIAREHGSTVKHIQNANKIVNPARDLQVGQTIFIPVAQ
ncbi:MAG: LysM peptidoglycan-binding domain-containing protein [Opitutales bacterium]